MGGIIHMNSQRLSTFPRHFPQNFGSNFSVVLFEPEIPLNVGSIARTCACTDVPLHLVGTLGFRLDNRLAKRGGLDYWELVNVTVHRTWEEFLEQVKESQLWLFSTKGEKVFWDADFTKGGMFVFGSEREGLPAKILESRRESVLRIPMGTDRRSLNVSNAVAIVVFEALRQKWYGSNKRE